MNSIPELDTLMDTLKNSLQNKDYRMQ